MVFLGIARAAVIAAGLIAATALQAQELTLKRVLLSSGGLGYFEYEADVDGDATLDLTVRLDQVDDVLKSLIVFDDKGGVGGLDLPNREPLAETFRDLPFSADDLASSASLLAALRGAEVEIAGPRAMTGRIVSIEEEHETTPDGRTLPPRHRVALMSEKGLEQFVLEDADAIKFVDPATQSEIGRALKALAANREKDSRRLRLVSKGHEKRKVSVAYIVAAPLWKASYRLVLPAARDANQARLQGWATLENVSGQDWKNVDLTLVSGRPVTFRQELYHIYMVDRPEAPVEVVGRLLPGLDEGAIEQTETAAAPPPAKAMAPALHLKAAMAGASPAPTPTPMNVARTVAGGAETIAAQEGLTQVMFHLPFPVSVDNGRTLSLPIIDASAPVERVALYDPLVDPRHPLSAARLVNDGKSGLPPGIVTIYEQGADGLAYVGDSRLSDLPAGDQRILSYALDQKTLIDKSDRETEALTRGALAKGALTIETLERRATTYRVKATEPRKLIVETPRFVGFRLADPANAAVSESEGRYRIPFDVKAADGQTFGVVQEKVDTKLIALSGIDDGAIGFYVKARELDPATRDELMKLVDLRGKLAAAERALAATNGRINEVVQDQNRLKGLLQAVGAGSDLQKRYLGKLDQEETELDNLKATRGAEEKARDEARQAVEGYIAGL